MFGFGSSAHMTLQIARSWGCRGFVSSRGEGHRQLARELGAEWVGDANEKFPELFDSAIVFAPIGEIIPLALESVRKAGTVALAGIYMSDVPALNYEKHLFHEKNLVSVESNTRADGNELLVQAARIPTVIHTQTFQLQQANEALIALKADQINGAAVLVMDN
jgi:propanol-preferring alcohol dehydrogenase